MCFQLFVGTHDVQTYGLDWRILPAACEIITLLIRPDLPIKGKSAVLPQPFKSQPASKPQQQTDRSSNKFQIYMRMSSPVLCAVILLACALSFSAAQTSCKGRCGAEYYRGYMCQCDYTCLSYGECCKDYESQCTTKNSCKGRCGESFKRGRLCSCDPDCIKYKQCCQDYTSHCDAEVITTEEMSGAASATAPVKTSSCDNVKDNKPKESPLNVEETFSEGNNEDDHLSPLDNPTSYPPDDPIDDTNSQIVPNDDLSNNGLEDPGASPIPEGSLTVDLVQGSSEPTLEPDTLELSTDTVTVFSQTDATPSDNEPTQADDSPSTLYMTSGVAPTENTDASDPVDSTDEGTTLPQPTTAADNDSSPTAPTSAPQTGLSPAASTPEPEKEGQATEQHKDDIFPEAQNTDPTDASSDNPEVTTLPFNTGESTGLTQDYTVLEMSQDTTTTASSMLDLTPIPDATASNSGTDDTVSNSEDPTAGPLSVLADATDDATPQAMTADPMEVTSDPSKHQPSEPTSKPQDKPDQYKPPPTKPTLVKPISKPETKPLDIAPTLNTDNPRDYQADDSNDTNLCSGRPVSAVTTLRNGTIVVFRGHYFWVLDRNRMPGPAQGITQVWGVPSPIDTVFTRCNCQGKTYIFRGTQYWRFENDVLDPGYPKAIEMGFNGLRGHITAALSVPQYQTRRESVYFFKRGGLVQKYSYQFGTGPTCGRKPQHTIYTVRHRMVRQAVSLLGPTINIRTSWRGFPSTVTAAVSVPNREPEGYKYYVFSRSKSYNVRMDTERPVIAAPKANTSPQTNDLFKCPKKV
ncbi:proteoglycan 4 isoform X1 [Seriola lalandi dorsalis]|uniref:Proteoglycan 4b n=1 Tax=Seriola lalandi dorsalis TaxID=1841481 RepID=A0A3B4WSF2_SERLL|nr:proteoglycan 4 isoform X1 [Seriola lalandi dorsalis]